MSLRRRIAFSGVIYTAGFFILMLAFTLATVVARNCSPPPFRMGLGSGELTRGV